MIRPDVVELKNYYASLAGQVTTRLLRQHLHHYWDDAKGDTVLGIGFATPLLRSLAEQNEVAAFMPDSQGVMHWPESAANQTLIGDETALPFADNSINRVILLHALEHSHAAVLLEEIWRILTPGGRVLVFAPNRVGIWSRSPLTPFGSGHPYSTAQLRSLLRECEFIPSRTSNALFLPPTERRYLLKISNPLEKLGASLFSMFGGVVIMEAEKQLFALTAQRSTSRKRSGVYVPATQAALPKIAR
jgi:SAM-dependent methyltransferase